LLIAVKKANFQFHPQRLLKAGGESRGCFRRHSLDSEDHMRELLLSG
jgi:hypothetical protein